MRRLYLMVLASLCVAACQSGSATTSSPSASPFEFKGTPSALVVREGDLPAGFHVHYESPVGPFEIVELLTANSTGAADALLTRGLSSSYARSFDLADSKRRGIASIVMIFRDATNAREAVPLLMGYARDRGCREVPVAMRLGDVSSACQIHYLYEDQTVGSAIYLYFSSANAVAYIGVSDDPAAGDGELLAALATKQLQTMWSFGGADLKGK